jgi:hypothetical protein
VFPAPPGEYHAAIQHGDQQPDDPNCPADDTCANTKAIRVLLALDSTWSTVVKIATVLAPMAGAPGKNKVVSTSSAVCDGRRAQSDWDYRRVNGADPPPNRIPTTAD